MLSRLAALGDHPIEQQARLGKLVLVARLRQEGDDPRHDRDVLKAVELLDPTERIERRVVSEKQEGRRAHPGIRIPKHLLDAGQDPQVSGRVEQSEGALAHGRHLVRQEVAQSGMRRTVVRCAQEVESVEHLLRVGRVELSRQDVGGGAVEHRRELPLGVEPPLPDALQEGVGIAPARRDGRRDPASGEDEVDERNLLRRPVEPIRENREREAGQTVAEPPDDGVDGRLRLELEPRRNGQIQKLHRRLVERVAHDRVAALEKDRGGQLWHDEKIGMTSARVERRVRSVFRIRSTNRTASR